RYRGNPERARFHRQHEADGFEIKVRDDLDRNGSKSKNTDAVRDANGELPVSLVRGLRRVSINGLADTYTLSEPRESMAPIVELSADGINSNYNRPVSSLKAEKSEKSRKRQQRPRKKDIDVKNIESVLQEAPTRMTRSMAKKIGVEAPRRYFGEGVSTSQILRPAKPAATQKPKREL
ncbi:hypothetical protein GGI11_001483, partial [Coemansia sp. RSA 2049]